MSNPTGLRGDAPLEAAAVEQLKSYCPNGIIPVPFIPSVGPTAIRNALAGLPVRSSTRTLISQGLERLDIKRRNDAAEQLHHRIQKEIEAGASRGDPINCDGTRGRFVGTRDGRHWIAWEGEDFATVCAAFDGRDAAKVKPVCPRCLDIDSGIPGGDPDGAPDHPHSGPFTSKLCDPCSRAVEQALRAEGRTEAADFERAARDKVFEGIGR